MFVQHYHSLLLAVIEPVLLALLTCCGLPGLIQVDAAIVNPTTLSPNHLLLRSNQRSQTLTFTASNAAPFPITYKMRHMPAAAVSVTDTWLTSDANDLLKPWAASAGFRAQGKAVHEITVPPGGSTEVEVRHASCSVPCGCLDLPTYLRW